eukprot:CAMPEP_0184502898 /NCGR_PEP_ID=MMETSP0113_2-20130426/51492_1 /TAXON_ID=91329 /ORGANISM="Norrisiella sphaerica, Strain BC52" /LENGTH=294 /DNA_ID=CAMNT_0026892267 /DNA_START=6 /DNA_END=890 /DNA_ORIENTATION=-
MDFAQPASLSIVCLMILSQTLILVKGIPASSLSYNYRTVVERRQFWRVITALFCHIDRSEPWKGTVYIIVNVIGLQFSSMVETEKGSSEYLKGMYVIVLFSALGIIGHCYLISKVSVGVRRLQPLRNLVRSAWYIRGLSSVAVGMLAALPVVRIFWILPRFRVPTVMIPCIYISMVIFVLPRANIVSDFLAVFIGILYGLGYFSWFSNYFFYSLMAWTIVGFILNLKMTSGLAMSWIYIQGDNSWTDLNETPVRTEVVDGRVIFRRLPSPEPARDIANENDNNGDEEEGMRLVG